MRKYSTLHVPFQVPQRISPIFPHEFTTRRVLPSLVSALEFGGASAAAILPLVLHFGANVPPEEYPDGVLTPLVKLFASPDRGTRMALLEHLDEYASHLDKKIVSEKIFPHLVSNHQLRVHFIQCLSHTCEANGIL
jgi:hypothetical protein